MPEIFLHIDGPLHSDPELETGGILTLERSDGRSVWRQRLKMVHIIETDIYVMRPVGDAES